MKFFRYKTLTIAWVIAILAVTLTPGPNLPPLPQWELISFDTFVHALIFGGLTFLLSNALRENKVKFSRSKAIWLAFILSLVFGILIEFIQPLVPGRTFSYHDILSNTIGCILGVVLVLLQWTYLKVADQ